jgi:P-type Cu+ transporter
MISTSYMNTVLTPVKIKCYHCGNDCYGDEVKLEEKVFCCEGCRAVYELLQENNMCSYYDFQKSPGIKIKVVPKEHYAYLDKDDIKNKVLDFREGDLCKVTFYIPKIHCTSCIWLLEHLHKINKGVINSQINFLRKEISISYREDLISLRGVVELLDSVGYTPDIRFEKLEQKAKKTDYSILYKIGIAGFCFGNIMMLSFPEYLAVSRFLDSSYKGFFGYVNLILALPVFFYSASEYFISAWNGLKNKLINIEFPIALGLLVVFSRSVYEVLSGSGLGFFDSLTGLIFFLLIGKWFQGKTYEALSFEKDFKSYFPLGITLVKEGKQAAVSLDQLKTGDHVIIRNEEIIPADSVIMKGNGYIDYSFVTGESNPVAKKEEESVFAGGKQIGSSIELKITKDVSHSYFTQLWNQEVFSKRRPNGLFNFTNKIGKIFTIAVVVMAALTYGFWYYFDGGKALYTAISVLIIFCPCTLALAIPFAFGNALRILGKNNLYLKNSDTIETLSKVDTIVFDKTGTLTRKEAEVEYLGEPLTDEETSLVKSMASESIHPLSIMIANFLRDSQSVNVNAFEEIHGQGISGVAGNSKVKLGSSLFVRHEDDRLSNIASNVYCSIDGKQKGVFIIKNKYREGIGPMIKGLEKKYSLHLITGDNDSDKKHLASFFPSQNIHFTQSPFDKLSYIKSLEDQGRIVLMLGDGLNDAGALKQSDVGITVAEDIYSFSPACDGILEGTKLNRIQAYLSYAKDTSRIVRSSLAISLLYNFIGIGFAITGQLTPLTAAIIMPLSSISIVLYVTLATTYISRRKNL